MRRNYFLLFLPLLFTANNLLAQLNCAFTVSDSFACPPVVISFTDQSTGGATSWGWDFDNGNTSVQQNPAASFVLPGIYNVVHWVSNGVTTDSAYFQIRVFVPATVDFVSPNNIGCIYPCHTVNFTNTSIAGESPIVSCVWDFSDGPAVPGYNASHCFNATGLYTITLVVMDSNGCQTSKIIPNFVQISNNPVANASASPTQSCTSPSNISFTGSGTSSNGAITYNWFFGNGSQSNQQNPSGFFVNGIYDPILVVTDAIGCKDTAWTHFEVTDVDAGFTSAGNNACSGVPFQFTDTSNFASSWLWDFGDGTTATVQNPQHVYSSNGTYTVSLTITYNGCTDSEVQNAYVTVTSPINFSFSGTPTSACLPPLNVNFSNNAVGATSYLWDFGDGSTSTSSNPTHTYNTLGTFTVSLSVSNSVGCINTVTLNNYITLGGIQAAFTIDSSAGCSPLTVNFTDQSTSAIPITSWQWFFGDGGTSTQHPVASNTYNVSGNYTPTLIVQNAAGCADTAVGLPINVGQTLNPDFFATPLVLCVFQTVMFFNTTTGTTGQTSYLWDFGDNTTSTLASPTHQYSDTGFFDVTLTIINQGCASSITFDDYIQILVPRAAFVNDFACSNPTSIQFIDTSLGADTWFWDFGDATTSTLQDPLHNYAVPGDYTITLVVSNQTTGCYDSTKVTLSVGTPKAGFTAVPLSGCAPLNVQFTDTSVAASSWYWDFGDGTISSASDPTHTYYSPGVYSVKLVINPSGACRDSILKLNYITVQGPDADFGGNPMVGCNPFTASFTDSSTSTLGAIVSWLWTFGNGNSSTLQNPSAQFDSSMVYAVMLEVTDNNGCTASVTKFVRGITPIADFISDTIACPGEPVQFANLTNPLGTCNYVWHFGDGTTNGAQDPLHIYSTPNNYSVTLIASQTIAGITCYDTVVQIAPIHVENPIVDFFTNTTFAPCPPFPVQFYNISNRTDLQWLWKFDDGDTSGFFQPLHVFFFPGDYDITLIGYNQNGCYDSITYVDLIHVRGPIGNFAATPDSGCVPLTISITGTTQSTVSSVADMGDGTTFSNVITVTHTFDSVGTYYPIYTLTDSLGCVVAYPVDTIVVGLIPYPNLTDTTVCKGNYVQFNLALGDFFQWSANLSPDYLDCDTCRNPISSAPDTITYYVTATTIVGCAATDTMVMYVDALPQIFPGVFFRICPNDTLQLSAGPNVAAAVWTPNLFINDTNLVNPLVFPPDTQVYRVTGTNSTGCSISRIVRVYTIDSVRADINVHDTLLCDGNGVQLEVIVNEASANDTSFLWTPPNFLSSDIIPNPFFNAPHGMYDYQIVVSSSTCAPYIDSVHIIVAPLPSVEAGDDQTVTDGTTIQVWAASPDRVNYVWSNFLDSMTCTNCRRPYITVYQNQTLIVRAINEWGCYVEDSVILKVVACEPEMVFVPNTFTPNNDGINDLLYVRGIGLRSLEYFRVYDRWGGLVYETKNINDGWDGTVNGRPAEMATYVYLVSGLCSSGNPLQKSGNVTLIR